MDEIIGAVLGILLGIFSGLMPGIHANTISSLLMELGLDPVFLSFVIIGALGAHTVISQRSYLYTGNHDYTKSAFDISAHPIRVGSQAWIASDVFVAPGVKIGDGTVVGVRSTVLHDLPAGMVCFGTPAKPVKDRYACAD